MKASLRKGINIYNKFRKSTNEQKELQSTIELKDKQIRDQEIKNSELKKQIETLQSAYSKSQTEVSKLEVNNTIMHRQSIELKKNARQSVVINEKVNLTKNNLFSGLLKKTGENKFLKQAKEEGKE
jgi:hypothetical protein